MLKKLLVTLVAAAFAAGAYAQAPKDAVKPATQMEQKADSKTAKKGGMFADRDLIFDFTLLASDRLYNVRDFRFYRGEPPLRATPLPARLSPLSPNPIGDYHAIRVP